MVKNLSHQNKKKSISFEELYERVKDDRKYSHWSARQTIEQRIEALENELEELKKGLLSKDKENILEEIGDVLWDTFALVRVIEEEKNITKETIIATIIKKMQERKPYVFEKRKPTQEEERTLWKKAKQAQKAGKDQKEKATFTHKK